MTQSPTALVDFIMSLFQDPQKASEFDQNPGKCMADAGLADVPASEVNAVIPIVAESVSSPGGGGGSWSPSVPSHGSSSQIIQNIVNQYYDQSVDVINIGSGNVDVDVKNQNANGEGSVVVGGDSSGPIATTGGVAGTGNAVGNKSDEHSIEVDKSIHGNNSGNASSTKVTDNSRNDSHNRADVIATSSAPAPVPMQPAPILVDPFDSHGGIPFVPEETFFPTEPGFIADPAPVGTPLDQVSDQPLSAVADPGPFAGGEGLDAPSEPIEVADTPDLGISTGDIVPPAEEPSLVGAESVVGSSYSAEPAVSGPAEAPVIDSGDADF